MRNINVVVNSDKLEEYWPFGSQHKKDDPRKYFYMKDEQKQKKIPKKVQDNKKESMKKEIEKPQFFLAWKMRCPKSKF